MSQPTSRILNNFRLSERSVTTHGEIETNLNDDAKPTTTLFHIIDEN